MLASSTSKRGVDREARAALLKVRTGPDCPKGNLRELTWDSNSDCGITIPWKALRHSQAGSQNKELSRASWLQTGPPPAGDRQVRAARAGRGQSRPQRGTKLQAGFIANQDFLGFWTVYIRQEGCNQKSAPQKRHTAHLRRRASCTPRKLEWQGRGRW